KELRCEGFDKGSRAGSNTSNVNFPLIEHVMSFRSDLEVESPLSTETGVFYESHVRVVPTTRAERVSGSKSVSSVSNSFGEVSRLHPGGIWIECQICANVSIRRASQGDLLYISSSVQPQSHNARTDIAITVWIE